MVGSAGLRCCDADDLEQELALAVVQGLKRHDPARGSVLAFCRCIINTRALTILQHRFAAKRDTRRCMSLAALLGADLGLVSRSGRRQDLAIDLKRAIAALPEELQQAAALFVEHGRISAVARHTHFSRQRVRTLRRHLARHLRAAGIEPQSRRAATKRRSQAVIDQQSPDGDALE